MRLLVEALESVFEESGQTLHSVTDGLPPRHALARISMSIWHRLIGITLPQVCPIVALNSELPRQSRKFRTAFDVGVKLLLGNTRRLDQGRRQHRG